jgi:hypothetical protein
LSEPCKNGTIMGMTDSTVPEQDADGYYGDDMDDEGLDLSFLEDGEEKEK